MCCQVLQVCDELGVETAPAEVAAGLFVLPMFSWYSRDFISKAQRQQHASKSDAEAKAEDLVNFYSCAISCIRNVINIIYV